LQIIDHSEYSFTLLQIGRFADVLVYVSFHWSGDEILVLEFAQSCIEHGPVGGGPYANITWTYIAAIGVITLTAGAFNQWV
jgi:hypothetical protein